MIRASVHAEIQKVIASSRRLTSDNDLMAIAAQPDTTGIRGTAVANVLVKAGDKAGARDALLAGLAATSKPTTTQRLAYSNALSKAGYDDKASILLSEINPHDMTPSQKAGFDALKTQFVVNQSEKLIRGRHREAAKTLIASQLSLSPENIPLRLALARLYQADSKSMDALRITKDVLQQTPDDLNVQQATVGAAIGAGDLNLAGQIAANARVASPKDSRAYLMTATVSQARGNQKQALADLLKARSLYQKEQRDRRPE
jgi:thioredoxin-like negative regulator of GroEL